MARVSNASLQRDYQNGSTLNFRNTATQYSDQNQFMKSFQVHKNPSSNSSSPTSTKFSNAEYKKVRNYHNLYEQPSYGKMKELQERHRLGPKKVRMTERLPPLQIGQFSKVGMPSNILPNLNQKLIMKRIQRDQEQRLSIDTYSQLQSPNLLKDNSIADIEDNKSIDDSKQKPEEEEEQEIVLSRIKPVLRKNLNHHSQNVILTFKSAEIFVVEQNEGKQRPSNPIYVPLQHLKELMGLSNQELEIKLLGNLKFQATTNSFVYQQSTAATTTKLPKKSQQKPLKQQILSQQSQQLEEIFPDEIFSSMFIHEKSKDYKIIIKFPSIEYSIQSKQFLFIKTLSRSELKEYIDSFFTNWEDQALRHFMQYRKFVELLRQVSKETHLKQNSGKKSERTLSAFHEDQMNVYVLTERNGIKIKMYSSLQEYKNEILSSQNTLLKGCFERDGIIGNIEMKSFMLKISCLTSNYEYNEQIKLEKWTQMLSFMQTQIHKDQDNPKQIIETIAKVFTKYQEQQQPQQQQKQQVQQEQFSFSRVKLNKYQKLPSIDEKSLNSARKKEVQQFFKSQKRSKILTLKNKISGQDEKFLIELEFPSVSVYYDEQQHDKVLSEADCIYLNEHTFQGWNRYIMNQHFRLELNIGSNEPLPRIMEDKREEDDAFSEGDLREKYPPADEDEKQRIESTRGKLSQWFPY